MQPRYQTGVTDQVKGLDIFLGGAMVGLMKILGMVRREVFFWQKLLRNAQKSALLANLNDYVNVYNKIKWDIYINGITLYRSSGRKNR